MSLNIITGKSGAGKSYHLYQEVIASALNNSNQKFFIIVPEQYTLSIQKQMVSMHPNRCIMNIDVLSFNRLASLVFEELGESSLDMLDDVSKNLLLMNIAIKNQDSLTYLKAGIRKPQFIGQLKSVISEFMQYRHEPEALELMAESEGMPLVFKKKMADLKIIYDAFLTRIEGEYVTSETILSKFAEIAADSEILENAVFVFDGFTGFTPIQYQVFEALLKKSKDTYVTVTADEQLEVFTREDQSVEETNLFAMSADFIKKISRCAVNTGVEISDITYIDGSKGRIADNEVITHLERNLYRKNPEKYQKQQDKIQIFSAQNPREELKNVAITIKSLIKTQGYSYSDFAVICPDIDSYRNIAKSTFKQADVPVFIDAKTKIAFNPFVECLDALCEVMETDFSAGAVIRFLRCGYIDIAIENIDKFERFITETSVRGYNRYKKDFTTRRKLYVQNLGFYNQCRTIFWDAVKDFADVSRNSESTVADYVKALYQVIISCEMPRRIKQDINAFTEKEDFEKALEYQQVYKLVMEVLDRLYKHLGEECVSVQEFRDLLLAAKNSSSVAVLPPDTDVVLMGDIKRSRLDSVKVLFLVGANDSAIPLPVTSGGVLSAMERQRLIDNNFELAPSDRQQSFSQRFYIYLCLSKPKDRLYISHTAVNSADEAQLPSSLISDIADLFEGLKSVYCMNQGLKNNIYATNHAKNYLIELLDKFKNRTISGEENEELKSLLGWYSQNYDLDKLLSGTFFKYEPKKLPVALSSDFGLSVTAVENYNKCPYSFYLKSIMGLGSFEDSGLTSFEMGEVYHGVVEQYIKSVEDFESISSTEVVEKGLMAVKTVTEVLLEDKKGDTALTDYLINKVEPLMLLTLNRITDQIKRGSFRKIITEERFSRTFRDESSGHSIKLTGRIDRYDIYEDDENVYVRVVDYKSSRHTLNLVEIYAGISLQLPLYFSGLKEKLEQKYPDKNIVPVALQYYHVDDPYDDVPTHTEEETQLELAKKLRMSGMVSNDLQELHLMDNDLKAGSSSLVCNVRLNKDGDLYKDGDAVDKELLNAICDYAASATESAVASAIDGNFEISPYEYKGKSACTYCSFRSICGMDLKLDGYKVRHIDFNEDEIRKDLLGE